MRTETVLMLWFRCMGGIETIIAKLLRVSGIQFVDDSTECATVKMMHDEELVGRGQLVISDQPIRARRG
jgi:hypothetical protein